MNDLLAALAAALPDVPKWVEARGMLCCGVAEVTGGASLETGFVVRVVHGARSAVAVVGQPAASAILEAVRDVTAMTPVVAQIDNADHVRRSLNGGSDGPWTAERAIVHREKVSIDTGAPSPDVAVRMLQESDPLIHLPAGLRHEISHALAFAPVGAVFVDGLAASFCYPCWTTETLWDISVDTLEPYRGRGLAQRAVRFMIAHMRRQGREPVWSALESNAASLRVAAKLGFEPVDAIVVFSRGPWAFLTGGFGV